MQHILLIAHHPPNPEKKGLWAPMDIDIICSYSKKRILETIRIESLYELII